jgi:excisionase family DNA binding protein
MDEKKCLKTTEVAREFGVSSDAVVDWIVSGLLKAYKIPRGHYRVPLEEVEKLKERFLYVPNNELPLSEELKPALNVIPYFDDLPEKPFPTFVMPGRIEQKKEFEAIQGMVQDYCEERGITLGGPDETSEGE